MSEAGPRVNGPASPTGKYIDGIDPDDPEYIKNLQRPAEVKEDLQQMENRSRVSLVLNSQAFKEELEQVVEEQLRHGPYPASLIALQQITDLLLPHSKGSLGSLARAATVIPINDLRGVESLGFVKGEKILRCKLAALYRIIDLCGWSNGIYNHISARVSPDFEHFLLNPFGMLYSEITSSSLIKVDVKGDIVEPGSTQLGVSKAGFSLHSAIHQARPDIKCIVHLHTPATVAVSAMKCGLLPMSQEALICGKLSYHDYQGLFFDPEERDRLTRNLGVYNKILVLRNHGILACGETIEEAFHFTFNVMAACEAQIKAVPAGLENIVIPSEETREKVFKFANQGGGGVESTGRKWKVGELEFEALMRTLDNSGYRTGYVYKLPFVKQEKKDRSNSEVEIPPASSSFTYVFDGDYEHSKYASPIKAAMERQKKAYKAGWLTTPNAYKKTEVEEIGTTTPKKITKWVPEGESDNKPGGTPIKIEHPNQFAPQGENPKEYKEKQKSIRKDYYEEKITAGPQSKILEGISWDEAQRAKDGLLSGAGDQLIVVGAASKGIIQRDHQHNAVVYRQYYAANPFENMSEAEIEQYQAEVQRREKGEPVTESVNELTEVKLTSQQPVMVVQPSQPELPRQPEQVPVTQKEREVIKINQSPPVEETRTSTTSPEPQQTWEDKGLIQLADTVVQTVISDALSVLRRGKGQQILTGTEPLHQHSFNSQQLMGSQIKSNLKEHSLSSLDKSSNSGFIDKKTMKQSHRVGQNIGRGDDTKTVSDNSDDAAGAAMGDLRWQAAGASTPEDFLTIQLDPVQLYHGPASEGTMKVKFTIHSTVRRCLRANDLRGNVESFNASISKPVVERSQNESLNKSPVSNANSAQSTSVESTMNTLHLKVASTNLENLEPANAFVPAKHELDKSEKCDHDKTKFLFHNCKSDTHVHSNNDWTKESHKQSSPDPSLNSNKRLLKKTNSKYTLKTLKLNDDKIMDDSLENILLSPQNFTVTKNCKNECLNLNDFLDAVPLASIEDLADIGASSLHLNNEQCPESSSEYFHNTEIDVDNQMCASENSLTLKQASAYSDIHSHVQDSFQSILDKACDEVKVFEGSQQNKSDLIENLGLVPRNVDEDTDKQQMLLKAERDESKNSFSKTISEIEEKIQYSCNKFIAENKTFSPKNVGKKEILNDNDVYINSQIYPQDTIDDNIKSEQSKLTNKKIMYLDEGPLQTSSPKLGRSKSKDSPFKTYPEKLGKSEETLLDIIPTYYQWIKAGAKSEEELEGDINDSVKGQLSRTVSLGPHHKKKRSTSNFIQGNLQGKSSGIEEYPLTRIMNNKDQSSSKLDFNKLDAILYNDVKISDYVSLFKPPDIIAYPLSSSPPLPSSPQPPEGPTRGNSNYPQRPTSGAYQSKNRSSNAPTERGKARHQSENTQEGDINVPKRRWTPKQKRERRTASEVEGELKNVENDQAFKNEKLLEVLGNPNKERHDPRDAKSERKTNREERRSIGYQRPIESNEYRDGRRSENLRDKRHDHYSNSDKPNEQGEETQQPAEIERKKQSRSSLEDKGKVFVKKRESYDVVKSVREKPVEDESYDLASQIKEKIKEKNTSFTETNIDEIVSKERNLEENNQKSNSYKIKRQDSDKYELEKSKIDIKKSNTEEDDGDAQKRGKVDQAKKYNDRDNYGDTNILKDEEVKKNASRQNNQDKYIDRKIDSRKDKDLDRYRSDMKDEETKYKQSYEDERWDNQKDRKSSGRYRRSEVEDTRYEEGHKYEDRKSTGRNRRSEVEDTTYEDRKSTGRNRRSEVEDTTYEDRKSTGRNRRSEAEDTTYEDRKSTGRNRRSEAEDTTYEDRKSTSRNRKSEAEGTTYEDRKSTGRNRRSEVEDTTYADRKSTGRNRRSEAEGTTYEDRKSSGRYRNETENTRYDQDYEDRRRNDEKDRKNSGRYRRSKMDETRNDQDKYGDERGDDIKDKMVSDKYKKNEDEDPTYDDRKKRSHYQASGRDDSNEYDKQSSEYRRRYDQRGDRDQLAADQKLPIDEEKLSDKSRGSKNRHEISSKGDSVQLRNEDDREKILGQGDEEYTARMKKKDENENIFKEKEPERCSYNDTLRNDSVKLRHNEKEVKVPDIKEIKEHIKRREERQRSTASVTKGQEDVRERKKMYEPRKIQPDDSVEDIPPVPPRLHSLVDEPPHIDISTDEIKSHLDKPKVASRKSEQNFHKLDMFAQEINKNKDDLNLQSKLEKNANDEPIARKREPRKRRSYEGTDDFENRNITGRKELFLEDDEKLKTIFPLESPKGLIVDKKDKELEPYVYARGRRSGRLPKRQEFNKKETQESDDDDNDKRSELDNLMPDNPIELNIADDEEKYEADHLEETPTKKGIFNLFSCVGAKSTDILKKKSKDTKSSKKYYDEGEKRKIKKLTKEKEEKNKLYFQDPDEVAAEKDPIPVDASTDEKPTELLESSSNLTPIIAQIPDPNVSSWRYQKKQKSFEIPKPLSTFMDPDSAIEDILGTNDFEEVDELPLGTFTRWKEEKTEEPKLSSFMSAKREAKQLSTFRNFQRRPQKQTMDVEREALGSDSKDDEDEGLNSNRSLIKLSSSTEEPIKLKGGCPDMQSLENVSFEDETEALDLGSIQHMSAEVFSVKHEAEALNLQLQLTDQDEKITDKKNSEYMCPLFFKPVEIKLKPPTPESASEECIDLSRKRLDKADLDHLDNLNYLPLENDMVCSNNHVLNISAPAIFNIEKPEENKLDNSFDPSASFEADLMHRRKYRTVSFDERLTLDTNRSPDEVKKNSSSLFEEPITRPRSISITSNPLTYEPWRAKAYKQQHHRSLSASGMLHGRSSNRLHKSHSIGEIYNSTVASSVARRRAKTIVSGDITSRMYQPRQRSRSRALLGDASFGSVAPIRQRSFSGFDYATSAGYVEPTVTTVKRSESERQPNKIQMSEKEEPKNVERSKSDRRQKHKQVDVKSASPSKSDTLKSTDSASGGETLEDRSSKEGSPTKEHPSPTKEKKKKKKFRIPSFSKKKSKDNKESAI